MASAWTAWRADWAAPAGRGDSSRLPSATAERLLLAAERLFAARGVDGVSLRQVNVEAGQRNLSAAHYHFGSGKR